LRTLIIVAMFAFCASAQAKDYTKEILGKWQSDEAKTLEDISRHPEIPADALKTYKNHYYGRLRLIIQKDRSAAYFTDQDLNEPIKFGAHKFSEQGDNYLDISFFDEASKKEDVIRWYFDGKYMYTIVSKWKFREYYRKLDWK